jgi:hypothetical protein
MKISLSSCSWIEPEGAIDEALTAPSPAATASVVANNMVLSPTWLLAWSSFVAAMRRRQPRGGARRDARDRPASRSRRLPLFIDDPALMSRPRQPRERKAKARRLGLANLDLPPPATRLRCSRFSWRGCGLTAVG